jgi:WD40 repeat protein
MTSSTRRILFQTLRRHWVDLLADLSRRAVAAAALVLVLVVGYASTGLWHGLVEVERLDAAEGIKPREAQVKVKGVRTIPLDAPGYANVMAWAPDSRRLAVGGLLDKRMSVWDVRTGQRLPGPTDQMGGTHGLAYSPDGLYLAVARGVIRSGPDVPMPTGPDRYVVSVWDGRSGTWLQNLADEAGEIQTFGVSSIAFSPDSKHLVVSYTGGLAFYANDRSTWRRVGTLAPSAARLAYAPGGSRLVGTIGKEILVYEVPSGRIVGRWRGLRTGIESGFPSVAYRPDGNQVAVGEGAHLGLFDPSTGERVKLLDPAAPYNVSGLSYSKDSRYLAVAVGTVAKLLDAADGSTVAILTDHHHSVDRLAISPDGTLLAAIGGSVITIWELSGLDR